MIVLFLGLMLANFVFLIATAVLGYVGLSSGIGSSHRLFGALAAMVCCGVHCVVFTYFVATGKWVGHAILVKGLEPKLAEPIGPLRRAAFAVLAGNLVAAAVEYRSIRDNGLVIDGILARINAPSN